MAENKDTPITDDAPVRAEERADRSANSPSVEPAADVIATEPCSRCGSTLPPDERGLCPVPTCRGARKGNKLAAVHEGRAKLTPEDLATRDALMARLFQERGGREALDVVAQLRIEDYATAQIQLGKVTRRLEEFGAVSTKGNKRSSLVDTYNTFSARVERLAAELPKPTQSAQQPERVMKIVRVFVTSRAQLDEAMAGGPLDPQKWVEESEDDFNVRTSARSAPAQAATNAPAATEPKAEPEPCSYCGRPCVGRNHPSFETLHWNDPAEIEKRDAAATAEMFESLKRARRSY